MKRAPIIIAAIFVACVAGVMVEWSNRLSLSAEQEKFESYQHRDGKKEAETDIATGAPKWKVYGRVSEYDIRKTLLKEKLGLELDWFEGCMVSEAIERYTFDYNATIRPYLVSVHGEPPVYALLGEPAERHPASDR